jgi:hypothetical protein
LPVAVAPNVKVALLGSPGITFKVVDESEAVRPGEELVDNVTGPPKLPKPLIMMLEEPVVPATNVTIAGLGII